jgi:type II secretory pathway pseudopilin PulG
MRITNDAVGARGFTYLGLMFIIAVLALTATMASHFWTLLAQRASERELAFVGLQFKTAIERYRQHIGGADSRYPARLEDLLRDPRTPQIERHLRRIYLDPTTGTSEWGLVRLPDGSIVGVHSLSRRTPMQASTLAATLGFAEAPSYREWRFIAPSALALLQPAEEAPPPTEGD